MGSLTHQKISPGITYFCPVCRSIGTFVESGLITGLGKQPLLQEQV